MFSEAEREYAQASADPVTRLAARFAAKEAALKSLGAGLWAAALRDIEVARDPSGQPELRVSGRAAALAAGQGVTGWSVSLTHTAQTAGAVVLAIRSPGAGPPPPVGTAL